MLEQHMTKIAEADRTALEVPITLEELYATAQTMAKKDIG